MEPLARKILVVGGNGFVGVFTACLYLAVDHAKILSTRVAGSAVCRAALSRGYQVTSIRCVCRIASERSTLTLTTAFPMHTFILVHCPLHLPRSTDRFIRMHASTMPRNPVHPAGHTQLRKATRQPGHPKCGPLPSLQRSPAVLNSNVPLTLLANR